MLLYKIGILVGLTILGELTNTRSLDWHGVNIAGMDFGLDVASAQLCPGATPTYPSTAELDEWIALNTTMFRFPVLWNYLQPSFRESISTSDRTFSHLDKLIEHVTDSGQNQSAYAILDIHNFARYNGSIVGQTYHQPYDYDFMDLWTRLAENYKYNPRVMFGIMNEPHDLDLSTWAQTLQRTIWSIRNVTESQWILVEGTDWGNLSTWASHSGQAIAGLSDTAEKLLIDVHQYFDNSGGNSGRCANFELYRQSFENFTNTVRSMGSKAILTEFGGHNTTECQDSLENMLRFLEENSDVFFGWTAWGAGDGLQGKVLFLNPSVNDSKGRSVDITRDVLVKHMSTSYAISPSLVFVFSSGVAVLFAYLIF